MLMQIYPMQNHIMKDFFQYFMKIVNKSCLKNKRLRKLQLKLMQKFVLGKSIKSAKIGKISFF